MKHWGGPVNILLVIVALGLFIALGFTLATNPALFDVQP